MAEQNVIPAASRTKPAGAGPVQQFMTATELDTRLRTLDAKKQDKGEYLQPGDLNGYMKAADASKIASDLPYHTSAAPKSRRSCAILPSW